MLEENESEEELDRSTEEELDRPTEETVKEVGGGDNTGLKAGTLVAAIYEEEVFVAEVVQHQAGVEEGYTRLAYTTIRGINSFSWPNNEDLVVTLNEEILLRSIEVEPINSRGLMAMKKKDFDFAKKLMVVIHFFVIGWGVGPDLYL
jgi:hypothetical protein